MTDRALRAEVDVEVRYAETDQMGVVHHANYLIWFELARTNLCTQSGFHYRQIEELGYLLMVTAAEVRYRQGARFDKCCMPLTACRRDKSDHPVSESCNRDASR